MNQPYDPYQAPATASSALTPRNEKERAFLLAVARYQKGITLCILASFGTFALLFVLPGALAVIAFALSLLISLMSTVFVILLARTLYNTPVAILVGLLAVLPAASLLALLVLNNRATRVLRRAGLRVGLLGVDLEKLE